MFKGPNSNVIVVILLLVVLVVVGWFIFGKHNTGNTGQVLGSLGAAVGTNLSGVVNCSAAAGVYLISPHLTPSTGSLANVNYWVRASTIVPTPSFTVLNYISMIVGSASQLFGGAPVIASPPNAAGSIATSIINVLLGPSSSSGNGAGGAVGTVICNLFLGCPKIPPSSQPLKVPCAVESNVCSISYGLGSWSSGGQFTCSA